jgi:1-acyl-sn-glycerol-3-phosphate acyltransferase
VHHFESQKREVTLKHIDPSYAIHSIPASPSDSVYCWNMARNAVHAAMTRNTEMLSERRAAESNSTRRATSGCRSSKRPGNRSCFLDCSRSALLVVAFEPRERLCFAPPDAMVRAVSSPFRILRAALNSVILPSWTVLCVTGGVIAGTLTRDKDLFYRWQRGWGRGLFRLCGIDIEVSGEEHMQPDTSYVIVANHASYMDVPALFALLPRPPQFIAKRELSRIPFVGTALRWGRHVLIERGNRSSARDSLEQAASHVRAGAAVLVFPEGTRGVSDEVQKFKTGALRLAKEARASILPVGISGTRSILPKHGRLLYPGRISVRIGPALTADEVSSTDMRALAQLTRGRVAELARLPLTTSERPAARDES